MMTAKLFRYATLEAFSDNSTESLRQGVILGNESDFKYLKRDPNWGYHATTQSQQDPPSRQHPCMSLDALLKLPDPLFGAAFAERLGC